MNCSSQAEFRGETRYLFWKSFELFEDPLPFSDLFRETIQALLSDRVRLVRFVPNKVLGFSGRYIERSARDVRGPTEELEWFLQGGH